MGARKTGARKMLNASEKYQEFCEYKAESVACGYEYLVYSDWLKGDDENQAYHKLQYHLQNDMLELY